MSEAQQNLVINSLRTAIQPRAKVYVQELTDTLRGGSNIFELVGWSTININYDIGAPGRCSIQFPNVRDKYMRKKRARTFAQLESDQTRQYLLNVLSWAGAQIREVNPYRRSPLVGRLSVFRTDDQRHNDWIDNIYDFGNSNTDQGPQLTQENLLALGLMQRIWVDLQGRDGRWYAGFSGIITGINEKVPVVSEPTLILRCASMMRLMQLVQTFTQEGISPLEQNRAIDILFLDPSAQNILKSSVYADQGGTEIIRQLVNIAQITYSYNAYTAFRQQQSTQRGNQTAQSQVVLAQTDFFYDDPFWTLPQITTSTVNGQAVRQVLGTYQGEPTGNLRRTAHTAPGQEVIPANVHVADMVGKLEIDRYITEGPQAVAYALMIRDTLSLFQTTRKDTFTMAQEVAKLTFFEFIETPNGDLIYQIPKLNNFPGNFPQPTDGSQPSKTTNRTVSSYTFGGDGDYDYSPAPEFFYQKGHGLNYVQGDTSLRSWSQDQAEEPLVTYVESPVGLNLVVLNEIIRTLSFTGRTSTQKFPDLLKLQGRFGLRIAETPQVTLREASTVTSNPGTWDAYARAYLNLNNAKARTIDLQDKERPDLRIAQNMLHVERQVLGYITGYGHEFRQGGEFTTRLRLELVHDIADRITNPWIAVRDQVGSVQPSGGAPQTVQSPGGLNPVEQQDQAQFGFVPATVGAQFDPNQFLNLVLIAAKQAASALGQPARDLFVAHAMVETRFGARVVGNNLFNITANPGSSWTGPTLIANDPLHGRARYQVFRAYPDFLSSVNDYLKLLQTSRYSAGYNQMINADPTYIETIGQKGYYEIAPKAMRLKFNAALIKVQLAAGG